MPEVHNGFNHKPSSDIQSQNAFEDIFEYQYFNTNWSR